jgi:DNA-binding beta-propeller fold protein YncE
MKKHLIKTWAAFAALIATAQLVGAASSLTDTIELLPGPDAYFPDQLAINHTTHKVYVQGAAASGFQDLAVKVLDSTTGTLVGNIDLGRVVNGDVITRFEPRGIAADESANASGNRVYVIGALGNSFYIRTIQNDAIVAGADVALTGNPDPYVGFSPITVNSNTHKVYFVSEYGQVTVVDGPSHSNLTTFDSATGYGPHLWVTNPDANKIFLFGRSGAVVIDGTSDTATPMTVPPQFTALTGVYNQTTGRVYVFAADKDGNRGIYSFNSNGASAGSVATSNQLAAGAMTVDPASNTIYLGAPGVSPESRIYAYSAADLSSKGSFNQGAAWLGFDSGRIFVLHHEVAETRNRVGILNVSNGSLSTVTLGYKPAKAAVNAQSNRVYVIDEANADLVVISGADHSILARVPVNPANSGSFYAEQTVLRTLAVSEALNRIYLPRGVEISEDGTKTFFLDVIDGSNNQLITSIPLLTGNVSPSNFLAVDDSRHRVYITGVDDSNNPVVRVINADTNSVTTSFPTFNSVGGLAVNPVTGKIYVSGRPNGGQVQIFDGTTFASRGTVSAGAVPGPMAVNPVTNKIYVANWGAESVDNSVTVINGATDATETTFSNTNQNNGDAVSDVAVDPVTNRIFVADNSNGVDATGRITIFNGANNSFQQQIEVGRYPNGLAFNTTSKEVFVPNNEDGTISVIGSGVAGGPPVPAHGGLSATVFRVNGSQSASPNVADTALHFAAQQSGTPAGLVVHVQYNTTSDNNAIDWVDLNNGSKGYMTMDNTTQQFVLSSTNYPTANGIYFRAVSVAPGFSVSKSNVVGPFNLTPGKGHLSPTTLYVATNGPGREIKFRANVAVDQPGTTLNVQATTTPDDDNSWAPLPDGRDGQLDEYADHVSYFLETTKYLTGDPVYFRAVASESTLFVPSISNIVGVKNVITGTPPTVEVLPPPPQPGSQSGTDAAHPIIATYGGFQIGATSSSPENKQIKKLGLIYDGATIDVRESGATNMTTQYATTVPGDHVIKAFATDERGITGYANPVYVRVKPPNGKVFTLVASGGNWSEAASWRDENGNPGVPGVNDLAIVGNRTVTVNQNVTTLGLSLVGGTIQATGATLGIGQFFSAAGGLLKSVNLDLNQNSLMALAGDASLAVSGSVTNHGTIRVTGRGGIVPAPAGAKSTAASPANPNGVFDGIGAFFQNLGTIIFHRPSVPAKPSSPPAAPPPVPPLRGLYADKIENQGLITNDGGSVIGNNGTGLVGNSGGTVISNDGASLITNDGGSIISTNGAGIISNDAAGIISNDGASGPADAPSRATIQPAGATGAPGFVQIGGETDLSHLVVWSSVQLDGGTLSGSGVIDGSLTNNSGFISPGHSAGTIAITGNFSQAQNGTLIIESAGKGLDQLDLVQVGGTANLGGNLHVKTINGFVPDAADAFNPLGYGAVTGTFNSVSGNVQITQSANGALLSLNSNAPQPQSGQPLNIATRMSVQAGDNVLIAGFIITGPTGSTKKVLIRGLGPSLAQFGVPNTLSDPLLELHKSDGTVTNDDWQQGDTSQIPNGFAPANPREAVIVATLAPGNYSAVVKGAHGETGVGIAEVYDLDAASPAKLGNIATRGFINTGDDVMIGGFIVGGNEPAKILIRAIGPTLSDFGVQGALQDPTLELHDSNGMSISNDNWRETQEAEIIATTIPPNKNQEPAILATLVPGNYTAVVRGKNNTTGVGLVEAYNLQ